MLRSLKDLTGYTVYGKDGNIGSIDQFYFDDNEWIIRYLVLDTRDWMDDRRVLISPVALGRPDDQEQVIPANLTRDIVRDSPEIDTANPVSRQQEIDLYNHFQWPFYWGPATVSGVGPGNLLAALPLIELEEEMENQGSLPQEPENPNLRSSREVVGYKIQARDGGIGSLDDIIIEDEGWKIVYLIVDTGGWLSGKKVLVSPQWIEEISWSDRSITVDLKRETIQNSPEYDPSIPLDRGYETRLYDYYGREKYW